MGDPETLAAGAEGTLPMPVTNYLTNALLKGEQRAGKPLKPVFVLLRTRALPFLSATEHRANSNSILVMLWQKLGLPPMSLVAVLSGIIAALLKRLHKKQPLLLTHLFGVLYPVFRSIKAVERPTPDDDERWLTYWSVFGLFTILDNYRDKIMHYIRFYYVPKMLIFYWLFARNGSLVVYRQAVRPFLVKYADYRALAVTSVPDVPESLDAKTV
ncbi:TB2/DP1, HVA22 family-domain-containing protein [Gaertneriomyces semiglobifer]|nr:TB2/DP1, HVA22 family-domain-containing protein [Gaertneriomyces semiglobifer]